MIQAARSRRAPAGASYRVTQVSGALATVTGGQAGTVSSALFGWQWISTGIPATATYKQTGFSTSMVPLVCMITQVEVNLVLTTAPATAADLSMGLVFVSNYSALGTGGTIATFTASSQRFDTNYPLTNFASTTAFPNGNGAIQIATTANLGTLTGTVDLYPYRTWNGFTNTVGLGVIEPFAFEMGNDPNSQALWIRNGNGFVIQPLTAWATVVANLYVTVEWIEMSSNYT